MMIIAKKVLTLLRKPTYLLMELVENKSFSLRQINGSVYAFILITACFALWGFANNVTTPMVGAFSKIFRISTTEAAMVPVVFHLGYFCMAFPAAIFIQRYTFKTGVLVGLGLYALGALLFLPAKAIGLFAPFLIAYFVMTCGLSFLETSCNPYVFCLGKSEEEGKEKGERKGIQRLNAAQAFNAIGSLVGMLVAMSVHSRLSPVDTNHRLQLPIKEFDIIKNHDLSILIQPYIYISAIVIILLVVIFLSKKGWEVKNEVWKEDGENNSVNRGNFLTTIQELLQHKNYREGVIAEFCYVGAQAGCWTYIILYGTRIFMAEGMTEQESEILSQEYNIIAMIFFACGRFVCTWLMQWFSPERLLSTMGIIALSALIGVIFFTDRHGIYCLVTVSICLSLMFPTIYGLALRDIGKNIKIAGAGLIMAILGGSFFPPIQAMIIESEATLFGLPSTNLSFFIPLICLAMIIWFGHRAYVRHSIQGTPE